MARKRIAELVSLEKPSRVVKVYRDSEWQEWLVRLYVSGALVDSADYHTDSRDDAMATGRAMLESGE